MWGDGSLSFSSSHDWLHLAYLSQLNVTASNSLPGQHPTVGGGAAVLKALPGAGAGVFDWFTQLVANSEELVSSRHSGNAPAEFRPFSTPEAPAKLLNLSVLWALPPHHGERHHCERAPPRSEPCLACVQGSAVLS